MNGLLPSLVILAANWLPFLPSGASGPCTVEQWKRDWPQCQWGDGVKDGRLSIVERDGRKAWRVDYQPGEIGTEKGGVGWRCPIAPRRAVELSYTVRFSEGFEWVKGGKLPGLCGGPENVSGGRRADGTNGFSIQLMWRAEGRGEAYVYHRNQQSNYGDSFAFPSDFRFTAGKPIRVRLRVTMNDPGAKNGSAEVWIAQGADATERQVLSRGDLEWRTIDSILIDSIQFETFHGGGDRSWAPTRPCSAEFADVGIRAD